MLVVAKTSKYSKSKVTEYALQHENTKLERKVCTSNINFNRKIMNSSLMCLSNVISFNNSNCKEIK